MAYRILRFQHGEAIGIDDVKTIPLLFISLLIMHITGTEFSPQFHLLSMKSLYIASNIYMLEGNEGIIKQNTAMYGSTKMQGKCSYLYRSCLACDLNCTLHDKCTSLKEGTMRYIKSKNSNPSWP